jgi:hypothetical protein
MAVGQGLNVLNMFHKFGNRKTGERPEISQTNRMKTSAVEVKLKEEWEREE